MRHPSRHPRTRFSAFLLAGLALAGHALGAGPAMADEYLGFRSPTGNIHCVMMTGSWAGVRCDMRDLTPSFKHAPAGCDLDWGNVFVVEAQGKGQLGCAGDTVINPSAPVLDYGRSVTLGAFTCTSEKSGTTCTNGQGHGFTLSRAKQKLF